MICDDGTAGVLGPSRPEVGVEPNPNIRLPASTSVGRVSAAAGDNIVREPVTDYHRDGALTAVSAAVDTVCADARNPTKKSHCNKHILALLLFTLIFTKAFDSVPHDKLVHRLKTYGINGQLLLWIKNFLRPEPLHSRW